MATLEEAIRLRSDGQLEAAIAIIKKLLSQSPDDPVLNYQCAWSHDAAGLESGAAPYYERALAAGLAGEDREGAYIGLGSTYRCLGQYHRAREVLEKALGEFPGNGALQTFHAMTLYNLREYGPAFEKLLRQLAKTSKDEAVTAYGRAIEFYADKLDQTWN